MITRLFLVTCNTCESRTRPWGSESAAWAAAKADGWTRRRNPRNPRKWRHYCRHCAAKEKP